MNAVFIFVMKEGFPVGWFSIIKALIAFLYSRQGYYHTKKASLGKESIF